MPHIFVSEPLPGDAMARLRVTFGESSVHVGGGVRGPLFARVSTDIEGILSVVTDQIDKHLIEMCPKLRVIANVAVGVDNIDLNACRARSVVVTNTPDVLTEATADLAFGLLLAAARRIPEGDREIRAGRFAPFSLNYLLGVPVHGKTLGIVGLGRIGQAMARRARGFGMQILYTQRKRLSKELERALGANYTDIDTLFRNSDVVSLHCPLTDETERIASRDRINSMKPAAILVNTSRGRCVDEEALMNALAENRIFAAGLDVFEAEPSIDVRLRTLANTVLTPHIGSANVDARNGMASVAVENVLRVLSGRSPVTPL